MPKKIPEHELEAILAIVAAHPDSVPVRTIRAGLPYELPPRMLQRRLAFLVERNRLVAEGRGKGRRYRWPTVIAGAGNPGAGSARVAESRGAYLPLSTHAEAIKRVVRQPVQQREPVGYRRDFLDEYRPNVTFYLPADTRQRLLEMGRQPYGEQPAGTHVRTVYDRVLIDLSWNSSRLEGNTYSLLETERLLELGEAAEGKNALDAQMILNHKAAIDLLVEQAGEIGFNRHTILNLHSLLAKNLLADPQAAGRLRRIPVGISGTVYYPPETPQFIDECLTQILDTAAAIADPFEQAFFALVHLAYLQGFEDVNKRVSRLAANIPLIRDNLSPLSFVDVPKRAYVDGVLGVYELNRVELLRDVFVWAYRRSCGRYSAVRQTLGEPDPFRLRYRTPVTRVVSAAVREGLDKKRAIAFVRQNAAVDIPLYDQAQFIEVVETELMSLHEGNFAQHRLRPAEFEAWQRVWQGSDGNQ